MSIIMNNLIKQIEILQNKISKCKNDIRFYQKEIYKNKNFYGVLYLDSKNLMKTIDDMNNYKAELLELYKKQNDLIKNQ